MRLPASWAAVLIGVPLASALKFTVDTPNPVECGDFSVSWTGGQGPFHLLLTPIFGVPRNYSLSNSSPFRTQLPFPSRAQFLVTLFDSTGFQSGVTIPQPLTVAPSAGVSCNATTGGTAFTFSLNTALRQCSPYTFTDYVGAVQPVTILGIIPGGETFALRPPNPSTTYDWVANVASGTSIVFIMFDSRGRQGGSSALVPVLPSGNDTCLGPSSPSSTSTLPSSTSGIPASSTPSSSSGSSIPVGVVVGIVLGGLVLLAAFISLGLFILRRFARKKGKQWDHGDSHANQRFSLHTRIDSQLDRSPPPLDLPGQSIGQHAYPLHPGMPTSPDSTQHLLQEQYIPTPFVLGPPSQTYSSNSRASVAETSVLSSDQFGSSSSGSQRKAAMAGVNRVSAAPRFIVHSDVEEIGPNEDGIIELPPQYSATRAPLQPEVFAAPPPQQAQTPGLYMP